MIFAKKNIVFVLLSICLFFSANAATPMPAALVNGSGVLYDVNTGADIGTYEYKIEGKIFNIIINVNASQGITTYDGTTDYPPFEGSFSGTIDKQGKKIFIIKSNANSDGLYLVVHSMNSALLSKSFPESEKAKNLFLFSIMDKSSLNLVFDKKNEPTFTIYALKPHLRTQAIISQ